METVEQVFHLGVCKVANELRMEDASKSIGADTEQMIGLQTSTVRDPGQPCAICYYDSDTDDGSEDTERQITRRTTVPLGRYAALCVCGIPADASSDDEVERVCSHVFHTACIYKWIKSDGKFTCPICRGGLQQQRLPADSLPEMFALQPVYVVKHWGNSKVKEEYFELGGIRDGLYRSYYQTGILELECPYVGGKRQGVEKHYYDIEGLTPIIKSMVQFHQDQKHGVCKRFTSTGQLIGESGWDHGQKTGAHIEWYTDGGSPRLRSIEYHQNGKRHGVFMKWSFRGELLLYGVYKDGEKNGRFISWFEEHHSIRMKEFYLNGIRHGRSAEYYESSAGVDATEKEIGWYSHGLRIGEWCNYWSNGQLKTQSQYNDVGELDGLHKEYNRFGRCTKVFRYDNGQLDGLCETFDDRSSVAIETATYRNGQLHGLYVLRYKSNLKPKLVKVFKNNDEIMMRWFGRNGQLLSSNDAISNNSKRSDGGVIHVEAGVGRKNASLRPRFVE